MWDGERAAAEGRTPPSQPRVVWNLFLLLLWLVDVTLGSSYSRMASDLYLLQEQNCLKV